MSYWKTSDARCPSPPSLAPVAHTPSPIGLRISVVIDETGELAFLPAFCLLRHAGQRCPSFAITVSGIRFS